MARKRSTDAAQPHANGAMPLTNDEKDSSPMAAQYHTDLNGASNRSREAKPKGWDVMGFLRQNALFIVMALIAGGWVLTPATKASVEALDVKVQAAAKQTSVDALKTALDTTAASHERQVAQFTKTLEKIDIRLGDIEIANNEMRVWATRIEDRLELKLAAPQSPIAPVAAVHRKPAKAPKKTFPF